MIKSLILCLILVFSTSTPFAKEGGLLKIGGSNCHHLDGGLVCESFYYQDKLGNQTPVEVQTDGKPVLYKDGLVYFPGVIDKKERIEIAKYCGWSMADATISAYNLTQGAKEVSVLGSKASPLGLFGIGYLGCKYVEWDAKQTNAFNSSARFIRGLRRVKTIVTVISVTTTPGL